MAVMTVVARVVAKLVGVVDEVDEVVGSLG